MGGEIREVYQENSVYDGESLFEPFKVSGVLVDVLKDGQPLNITVDHRGTLALNERGVLELASIYGERAKRSTVSKIVDFAAQGYDEDLGAYRMDHRDYDPVLKRFLTPDPLFLENPDHCVDSPHECNLFSYARGNPASFVDPSGKNFLIAAGILGGVKAATMAISYVTMKADQYFNHLPASDVARQNADFNAASNVIKLTTIGQIGSYALATPSGINATLTVATNPTLFERGKDFASGFIEGLTREQTRLPNSSFSEFIFSKTGEFSGTLLREIGSNVTSESFHNNSNQILNPQSLPAFNVETKNFGTFQ